MEIRGSLDDYEADVDLPSELENTVTLTDENGLRHVYTGGVTDLYYAERVITGNVFLIAKTEKARDKHALKLSTPRVSNWEIQDDGNDGCELVRDGVPTQTYRNLLEELAVNDAGIRPKQRLLDEVFGPIEKQLLEAYAKIWGK